MSAITIDLAVYSLDVVLRASHAFTSRCHVFPGAVENGQVTIELVPHDGSHDFTGEFANALLDTWLRAVIAAETRAIRELLVAQAFCEGSLLDRAEVEADEYEDPRGIAR